MIFSPWGSPGAAWLWLEEGHAAQATRRFGHPPLERTPSVKGHQPFSIREGRSRRVQPPPSLSPCDTGAGSREAEPLRSLGSHGRWGAMLSAVGGEEISCTEEIKGVVCSPARP